jgi:hypothetical protein
MTSYNQRAQTAKGKGPHGSAIQIMVSRGIGKVRGFSLSPFILLVSSIFFALYIIASVFVINDYFYKLRINRVQVEKLERLNKQLEETRILLFRSEQRLAILEKYGHDAKAGPDISRGPVLSDDTGSKKVEENDEMNAEDDLKERPKETHVEIKDLIISKEEEKMMVSFKIFNVNQAETARGYVHIIVTDKGSDPPQLWTYPKEALRDGLPINYRRGRLFVIKNFRTIRGEFFLDTNSESSLSLNVLVYNRDGDLILQKEFEARNTS